MFVCYVSPNWYICSKLGLTHEWLSEEIEGLTNISKISLCIFLSGLPEKNSMIIFKTTINKEFFILPKSNDNIRNILRFCSKSVT